jgi:hypothetical protein
VLTLLILNSGAPENGTVVYEQTVNAVFFKMQTSTRNQIKVLAQNPTIRMIVETNNAGVDSQYVYVGEEYGMQFIKFSRRYWNIVR